MVSMESLLLSADIFTYLHIFSKICHLYILLAVVWQIELELPTLKEGDRKHIAGGNLLMFRHYQLFKRQMDLLSLSKKGFTEVNLLSYLYAFLHASNSEKDQIITIIKKKRSTYTEFCKSQEVRRNTPLSFDK